MNISKSTTLQRRRQMMTGLRLAFRQIGSVAYQALAGWVEHNDSNMGAALAFYTMFAIAPILVIAVAVAGYVFGPQVAETRCFNNCPPCSVIPVPGRYEIFC
jgi:uncharacterized BrkB/YihY/UPF0761 family membrane protein